MPTATDLVGAVRTGDVDPVSVVEDMLARISCGNTAFGALQRVRHDEAIAEATPHYGTIVGLESVG